MIGRFAQVDPLADMFGQQSVSSYSAFWNNPATFEDKWGLVPEDGKPNIWERLRNWVRPVFGTKKTSSETSRSGAIPSSFGQEFINFINEFYDYSDVKFHVYGQAIKVYGHKPNDRAGNNSNNVLFVNPDGAQSGGGGNWATATLGFIAADVAIPEPTDAAWPKWAAYGVAGTAAAAYIHYAGKGNANYPGPWSYTYQHPSQNPIHSPPRGFDPKETPPGIGNATKLLIGGRLLYEMYDEYQQRMNQIRVQPYITPRDNTYVAQPQFIPYRPR